MKASEFVAQIQALIAEHGDLALSLDMFACGGGEVESIEFRPGKGASFVIVSE